MSRISLIQNHHAHFLNYYSQEPYSQFGEGSIYGVVSQNQSRIGARVWVGLPFL